MRIGSNYTQVFIKIGRGNKLQKDSENLKNAHIQRGLVTLHDLRAQGRWVQIVSLGLRTSSYHLM